MVTTRQQLMGWLEHCEREHPGKATNVPTWLCTMDAVRDAVESGHVKVNGQVYLGRNGTAIIYGLTDEGRQEFYSNLPRATTPR